MVSSKLDRNEIQFHVVGFVMASSIGRLKENKTFRQFAKFAIVGASSTAIDWTLSWLLYQKIGVFNEPIQQFVLGLFPGLNHPHFDAAFTIFKALSFIVATFNGYFWNRRWTFGIRGKAYRHRQLLDFYLVTGIGLLINTFIASQIHRPGAGNFNFFFALAVATFITMFWNFLGHKIWTFRPRK